MATEAPKDVVPAELLALPELQALDPQHLAFTLALVGPARFNRTIAGRIAGYKDTIPGSLKSMASVVAGREDVKAAVAALCTPLALSAIETLGALAEEATDADNPPAVRVRALELLARHHRLFETEQDNAAGMTINVTLGGVDNDDADGQPEDPPDV